jgi:hypothetical protein
MQLINSNQTHGCIGTAKKKITCMFLQTHLPLFHLPPRGHHCRIVQGYIRTSYHKNLTNSPGSQGTCNPKFQEHKNTQLFFYPLLGFRDLTSPLQPTARMYLPDCSYNHRHNASDNIQPTAAKGAKHAFSNCNSQSNCNDAGCFVIT